MCWSFARDHGLPFSHIWARVNTRFGVPVNAVWFMVVFAFLLGLPMLKSYVAFSAVVSISTIGLYISYAIPIFLRVTVSRKQFVKGAFHLGIMSIPIAIMAIAWVLLITVNSCCQKHTCRGHALHCMTLKVYYAIHTAWHVCFYLNIGVCACLTTSHNEGNVR